MKKVFFILISILTIGLIGFTSFNNGFTTYAVSSTIINEEDIAHIYTYEDSSISEYYGTTANAIDNVVSAKIKYSFDYKVVITMTEEVSISFLTRYISASGFLATGPMSFSIWNEDLYYSTPTNMNIGIKRLDNEYKQFYVLPNAVNLGNGYYLLQFSLYSGATYEIRLSGYRDVLSSGIDGSRGIALVLEKDISNGLNSMVDMLSTTNVNIFDIEDLQSVNDTKYLSYTNVTSSGSHADGYGRSLLSSFSRHFKNDLYPYNQVNVASTLSGALNLFSFEHYSGSMSEAFNYWYQQNYEFGDGWLYNISNDIWLTFYNHYDFKGNICSLVGTTLDRDSFSLNSASFNINVVDFEVLIDMPTYRSQNSLILYNYDYDNTLKYANKVTYRLYRDMCFYDIVYNGSIPNKQALMVDNPNIQNKTFSNYIYLLIDFDPILVPVGGRVDLGFDFNFGNFIEPFPQITANNSNQTFNRPSLPTDLTPRLNFERTEEAPWFRISLYFPVIKYIEYAFLWLLFYAPVVGDCTAFLYTFFNKFLAIFNIVLDLPMGTFVLSFIAFILCFKLFASFLPFVSDRVSVTFKNINNKISDKIKDNKQFEEKIKRQNIKKDLFKKNSKKIIRKEFKKFDKNTKKKFK